MTVQPSVVPVACCLSPSPHSARANPLAGLISAVTIDKTSVVLAKSFLSFFQRSLLDSSCRHLVQTPRYVRACAVFQLLVCDQVDAETDKWFYKNWLRIISVV